MSLTSSVFSEILRRLAMIRFFFFSVRFFVLFGVSSSSSSVGISRKCRVAGKVLADE